MSTWYDRWNRSVRSKPDPMAARVLASAITSAKRTPSAPLREQRSGRIDRTRLARVATGDNRVFISPSAPAPQRLRVLVVLDASGSMRGVNATNAMQVGRNLADAFDMLPNVKGSVWAHTESSVMEGDTERPGVAMYHLWSSGQPTRNVNGYADIQMGGTLDGFAVAYAIDELRETLKPGERGLVILVSDGEPGYAPGLDPYLHTRLVREEGARSGIKVVSVAIDGALASDKQIAMWGRDNIVPFNRNMTVLAKNMATAIGKNL